jgi:hypothetical protein
MDILGLQPGPQKRLMVVSYNGFDLMPDDDMVLVARAWKEIRGDIYVSNMKFCYDEEGDTVYCLCYDDLHSRYFRGYRVRVRSIDFGMVEVKNTVPYPESFEDFIQIEVAETVLYLKYIYLLHCTFFNL